MRMHNRHRARRYAVAAGLATSVVVTGGVAQGDDAAQPGTTTDSPSADGQGINDDDSPEVSDGAQPGTDTGGQDGDSAGGGDDAASGQNDTANDAAGQQASNDNADSGAQEEDSGQGEAAQPGTTGPVADNNAESEAPADNTAEDTGADAGGQDQEAVEPVETVTPVTNQPSADPAPEPAAEAPQVTNGAVAVTDDTDAEPDVVPAVAEDTGQDAGNTQQTEPAPAVDDEASTPAVQPAEQTPEPEAAAQPAAEAADDAEPAAGQAPADNAAQPATPEAPAEPTEVAGEQEASEPADQDVEVLSQAELQVTAGVADVAADTVTIPGQSVSNASASAGGVTVEAPTVSVGQIGDGVAEVGIGTDTPQPHELPQPVDQAVDTAATYGKHAAEVVPEQVTDAVPAAGEQSVGTEDLGARIAWDSAQA